MVITMAILLLAVMEKDKTLMLGSRFGTMLVAVASVVSWEAMERTNLCLLSLIPRSWEEI